MAFLAKIPQAIVSVISYFFFKANQIGFEQVFDNVIVKHMDALRKQIQSQLCCEPLFLHMCKVEQILTLIARIFDL